MKPLPAAPLTPEDYAVYGHVFLRCGHLVDYLAREWLRCDRRDAAIMGRLEEMRFEIKPESYPRAMVHAIMRGSEQATGTVQFP